MKDLTKNRQKAHRLHVIVTTTSFFRATSLQCQVKHTQVKSRRSLHFKTPCGVFISPWTKDFHQVHNYNHNSSYDELEQPSHPMSSRTPIHYSVIVPAYKENGNIRPLVTRIFTALRRVDSPVPPDQVEIIIVDDNSRDGSVENVQGLQREGYNVRIIVRTTERGLSSAVVRGFQEALGDNMLCMDADLQVSHSSLM